MPGDTSTTTTTKKGVSLAKGPAAIVGIVLIAFGATALIFGSHSFTTHAIRGTVYGKKWIGFDVNGWSSILCAGTGLALLLAAPLHWGAKTVSLIVALILGDAALLAFVDRHDALGIFAANHLTELGWAIAAGVLVIVALLPRVGGRSAQDTPRRQEHVVRRRETATVTTTPKTGGRVNEGQQDPAWEQTYPTDGEPEERPGARRAT